MQPHRRTCEGCIKSGDCTGRLERITVISRQNAMAPPSRWRSEGNGEGTHRMEAITVNYVENTDDWNVTVAGMGEELTEQAPGIIAARDRAEQLIESLKPETGETAVVHLLRGSALEFTTAYMTARLSRDTGAESDATNDAVVPEQTGVASQERVPATDSPAMDSPGTDETDEPTSTP